MLNKIVVNGYNLWVVLFVAIGTEASAYGFAIIGSTVGQPSFYTYFNLPAVRPFEIFRTPSNRRGAATAFMLMWGDQFLGVYVLANYGVLNYAIMGQGGSWGRIMLPASGQRCSLSSSTCFGGASLLDATQYIYMAEIFPHHLAFYLSSEVTLVAAPPALNEIGWRFYLVLIIPSLVYLGIIYFFFPETKGRTLEEIGKLFGDEANVVAQWYGISDEERDRLMQVAKDKAEGGRFTRGLGEVG